MARRVLMGQKSGSQGLWVSKPGVDVVTASDDAMLLAINSTTLQVIASGVNGDPGAGNSFTITCPEVGAQPFIQLSSEYYNDFRITYVSNTQISVAVFMDNIRNSDFSRSRTISYVVFNQPRG